MHLRILHNGRVSRTKGYAGPFSPHWHIKIWSDGQAHGEIIGRKTDFKMIQGIKKQLDEAETTTLFTEADSMRSRFVSRPPQSEDVMIEFSNHDGVQYYYVVPPEQQANATVLSFFHILNQLLQPYV